MSKSAAQFLNNRKYHVNLYIVSMKTREIKQKRTTITLPIFLCDMLAVKLTGKLSSESQKEVREWLQQLADKYQMMPNASTSQRFQEYVTYAISDKIISKKTRELRDIAFSELMSEPKEDTKTISMFD